MEEDMQGMYEDSPSPEDAQPVERAEARRPSASLDPNLFMGEEPQVGDTITLRVTGVSDSGVQVELMGAESEEDDEMNGMME